MVIPDGTIQYNTIRAGALTGTHAAWFQERSQVFAAIAYAAVDNELAAPKTELIRRLLELMLQGCIMELKESGKLMLHS